MTSSTTGKIMSRREHILQRPDMYIGSVRTKEEMKFIFNEEEKKIIPKKISYNPGFERIFIELTSNAIDNSWQSKEQGYKMTYIEISIDRETGLTTVKNDGRHIPIVKTKYEIVDDIDAKKITMIEEYPPSVFFGRFLAGTNFDDSQKRFTSGKNGIGAKATAVLSKFFQVVCVDPENKKRFEQTFENNMAERSAPKVTVSALKSGYTEVSFIPDFQRFGLEGYTDDMFYLFKKQAHDIAMITGLSVSFCGEKIQIKNLQSYAKLFLDEKTNFLTLKAENSEIVIAEQEEKDALKKGFQQISFVNGIHTTEGGIHVETWLQNTLAPLRNAINDASASTNKKKDATKQIKISLEQLKKYFIVFVNCTLDKPEFTSQEKVNLTHPKPEVAKISPGDVKKMISTWEFNFFIQEELKMLEDKKIARTDGKSGGFISLGKKGQDANWAGSKRSGECSLLLAEGDSAKSLIVSGIATIEDGSNLFGVLALKGKPMNVSVNSARDVNENDEIQMIKKMIGLQHGADYSKDEEFSKLRYGRVGFFCDADVDGFHIQGLLLNYFFREFPQLIDRGFVTSWSTPAVRINTPSNPMTFYSHKKFLEYSKKIDMEKCKKYIKYYKGLGTHDPQKAGEIFNNPKTRVFVPGEIGEQIMDLAFHKKFTDKRKEWMMKYSDAPIFELQDDGSFKEKDLEFIEGNVSLDDFVNHCLILFSLEDTSRSIPSMFDGLKTSQRKILYTMFKTKVTEDIKVVQLAGRVLEHACYHHGEASLHEAVVKLAQGFVGSNNIPLLVNSGQFGSRNGGGKDHASARYIFTRLEKIARKIFREEDEDVLDYTEDEGSTFEPKNYAPVIPMLLVNGGDGIGTGFATSIPSYNPMDLVKWIRVWIENTESISFDDDVVVEDEGYPRLVPWWRNFPSENVSLSENGKSYTTRGQMTRRDDGKYDITELPVELWTDSFKETLEKMQEDKHLLKIEGFHGANSVHFRITPSRDFLPDIETNMKKLVKTTQISNMVALTENGIPRKFDTVTDIMEKFCDYRYELYAKRKESMLSKYNRILKRDQNKYRFITEVISKTLIVFNRDEDELFEEMKTKKYDPSEDTTTFGASAYSYLLDMSMRTMTKQRLVDLTKAIDSTKETIKNLESKTCGDLWKQDLEEFEKEYAGFLKNRIDDTQKPAGHNAKASKTAGQSKTKAVRKPAGPSHFSSEPKG